MSWEIKICLGFTLVKKKKVISNQSKVEPIVYILIFSCVNDSRASRLDSAGGGATSQAVGGARHKSMAPIKGSR